MTTTNMSSITDIATEKTTKKSNGRLVTATTDDSISDDQNDLIRRKILGMCLLSVIIV